MKAACGITAVSIAIGAFLIAPPVLSEVIKKSSSGICHSADSPYYAKTKNFTAFNKLTACLDSGGWLPKGQRPPERSAKPVAAGTDYARERFGNGWADVDGDCQNSRQEALIAQSTAPVRFAKSDQCRVTAGRWHSPYSSQVIHDASKIDIDHVVPLKWAWDHGANNWSLDTRESFANNPANLLSVEASLNRQKVAKGLNEWLPPANQCQYIARFLRVVKTYKLTLSEQETRDYQGIRTQWCS